MKIRGTIIVPAVVVLGTLALSGCTTADYLRQSVVGHLDLLWRARPVTDWLAEPSLDGALRERLEMASRVRHWAVAELKLPDNASYRRYAELERPAAVWNVVAAPELSLSLKTWCFPVLGCVGYRGYYARDEAEALAASLRAEGLEANVYGVPAYSTLGWLEWLGGDPLLSTFIRWPEGELARLIFHELAHQVAYARDDTMFNESFATAVERLGGRRWLAEQASPAARAEYEAFDSRRRDFRALTRRTREALAAIYADPALDDAAKRRAKAARMAAMRREHEELKLGRWNGFAGYDRWFENANNATLAVLGAYDDLVPAFERLFEREGRSFERFYAAVARLAALPKDERLATLRTLP